MQVFVGHIGGLGYPATGKPVVNPSVGYRARTEAEARPLVKSQQAAPSLMAGAALRRRYDPTPSFVSNDKVERTQKAKTGENE